MMRPLLGASFAALCALAACGGQAHKNSGGSPNGGVNQVGQVDGPPNTGLPPLPRLTNIVAVEREDSVGIDFDPVDGAVDYRVYPLPAAGAISANTDGSITVKNAIYRCAGLRQTYDIKNDDNANTPGLAFDPFAMTAHAAAQPMLGYVYVTPGAGRVPVYAVAGYPAPAQPGGGTSESGWRESRLKIYTTDESERQSLLASNWRDDGIVFYVPAQASAATQTIYRSQKAEQSGNFSGFTFVAHSQYYFGAADQASHASDTTPPTAAFPVLAAADASAGTQPLMAVFYRGDQSHTELAVGKERYARALEQGNGPLWHVEWAGITQPATLVVEALASGCPYQGFLSAQSLDAPPHQRFYTLAELQAASPTGEVFINGQYDDVPAAPVVLARSFVQVQPRPHDPKAWDWYQGFTVGSDLGPVTDTVFPTSHSTRCDWTGCSRETSVFDIGAYELDQPQGEPGIFTFGQFLGQLWDAFDDTGQDVTGRVRFVAKQTANVAADSYLHVTMTTNIVSTARRYPQLIVSDQPAPIDSNDGTNGIGTATSNTLFLQTRMGPNMQLEAQAIHGLINGAPWNVNNQDPHPHLLLDFGSFDGTKPGANMGADPPFEHAGMDRMTTFDAYVSSQKLYVFLDGKPAGCMTYPAGFALSGAVTVTFGNVLYHETADEDAMNPRLMSFVKRHQFQETSRQLDDLGFKSGVAAPSWDESKLPCGAY